MPLARAHVSRRYSLLTSPECQRSATTTADLYERRNPSHESLRRTASRCSLPPSLSLTLSLSLAVGNNTVGQIVTRNPRFQYMPCPPPADLASAAAVAAVFQLLAFFVSASPLPPETAAAATGVAAVSRLIAARRCRHIMDDNLS